MLLKSGNRYVSYIHIPYCDSKCYYCSFNSYTSLFHTKNSYMSALEINLEYELERFNVQIGDIESIFTWRRNTINDWTRPI